MLCCVVLYMLPSLRRLAQMVSNPHQFDVMLLPNLYGNIVSNVGAGLVGGAGVVSGMNVGWDYVVFEQGARHTFTSMAAQNVANPTGMLLSATDMLKQLGYGRVQGCVRVCSLSLAVYAPCLSVCACVVCSMCFYVCSVCVCVYVSVRMWCVCVHACLHVCVCVCVCVCTHMSVDCCHSFHLCYRMHSHAEVIRGAVMKTVQDGKVNCLGGSV